MADSAVVLALLARAKARLRLQRTIAAMGSAAIVACLALLGVIITFKVHLLTGSMAVRVGLASLLVPLLALAWTNARAVPTQRVAKRIDLACGLSDRIGSALDFWERGATEPFMQAQLGDAAAHASRIDLAGALPLKAPREWPVVAVLGAFTMLVALVRMPACAQAPALAPHSAPPPPAELARAVELREDLAKAARELEDPELARIAREVDALLGRLASGEITRKDLFVRMAELEQRFQGLKEGAFEALADPLRKAGEALTRERPTREAGQAMVQDDLKQAQEKLQELAQALRDGKLGAADRAAAARALAKAAEPPRRSLDAGAKREQATERALAKQERALREPGKEDRAQSPEDRRKLEEQRRELERLRRQNERERARTEGARRQLDRLSRSLGEASRGAQAGGERGASSVEQAAGEMSRMATELRRLGEAERIAVQLAELKEGLRRAGGQPPGGERSGKDGREGKLREFLARAGGAGQGKRDGRVFSQQDGEGEPDGEKLLLPGPNGKGRTELERPGSESGVAGSGQAQARPADGIGDEHDPNLQGGATRLPGKKRDVSVEGAQGAGPTRSEVIYGAADRGFASRSYRKVYGDYTQVVEEVMRREQVPLGMRDYVKRYFNLIKPRDSREEP